MPADWTAFGRWPCWRSSRITRVYPAFAAALREETGLDPEFIGPGMLRVALDDPQAEEMRDRFEWQRRRVNQVHAPPALNGSSPVASSCACCLALSMHSSNCQ